MSHLVNISITAACNVKYADDDNGYNDRVQHDGKVICTVLCHTVNDNLRNNL